jgi:hypothetical protein
MSILRSSISKTKVCVIAFALGTYASRLLAGTNTWTTTGPPGGAVSVAIDPGNASVFYSVASQAWRSLDGGRSWQSAFLAPAGYYLLSDVAVGPSYTVYIGTCCFQVNTFKSPNAGLSWTEVSSGEGGLCGGVRVLVDPLASDNVYEVLGPCGAGPGRPFYSHLLKSEDGGHTFVPIEEGLLGLDLSGNNTKLAIDPSSEGVAYVWTATGLFKSINGGTSWSLWFTSPQLTADGITGLVVDHLVPTEIYTSTRTLGIFKSIDGGRSFFSVNGGLLNTGTSDLVIDPKHRGRLYAATTSSLDRNPEVFATFDGGASWRPLNEGLPKLEAINRLAIDPEGRVLLAATGEGVLEYDFPADLEPVRVSRPEPIPREVPPRPER